VVVSWTGLNYEIFAVFVFGCVASSRVLDNRFSPAVIALAATLLWGMISNVLNLLDIGAYIQQFITLLIAAAFVVIAVVNILAARKAPPGMR